MLCTAWTATGDLFLCDDLALHVAMTWLLATHWPRLRLILGLPGFIQMPSNSLALAPRMVVSVLFNAFPVLPQGFSAMLGFNLCKAGAFHMEKQGQRLSG